MPADVLLRATAESFGLRLMAGLASFVLCTGNVLRAEEIDFERDVVPILATRCLECHTPRNPSGGLALTTHDTLVRGGDSGPAIEPGKPEESYLLERVTKAEMPPPRHGKAQPLSEREQQIVREWIATGARWPEDRTLDLYERTTTVRAGRDWWSLQAVVRPELPAGTAESNPIDAFVRSRLAKEQFEPAPPADRRTLIRRVYFDLLGLPPSAREIEAFEQDKSPRAYEELVTRLLASPHFGERWGRHWLDVVRFAETSGYERDQEKPGAWKYRDWVIQSINDDKPYDRFILEQLAGDELPGRTDETVVATGFLRLGTWNDEPNDPQEYKYERLEDLVHATCAAFLGATVKCARCHDHKFDPIPQTDYYRIAAAFWPGPIEPRGRELLGGPTREELGTDALGWTDVSRDPPPLHLLKKGEPKHPEQVVEPGVLSMVPGLDKPFAPPATDARTTGRRLQLAQWIVDPRHPMTARVFVNRLWQHHFGRALVRTPDNFGFTGQKPTHPELLDWLADDFVRGGWTAKRLHFLILTSKTYQQSSAHPRHEEYAARDFDNKLWWRAERQRQDAEALRDAMLSVSGKLDRSQGGPSFKPVISAEALEGLSRKTGAWQASPASEQGRRSVYMYSQRSLLPPLMTTFDFCDTTQPCGQRDVSTVAPQALALLNGEFAHEQSDALAKRVFDSAGATPEARIEAAWKLALGRAPRADELSLARSHLERQQARFEQRRDRELETPAPVTTLPGGSVLHLRADAGVELDENQRVVRWVDQSGQGHHAAQTIVDHRPVRIADAVGGQPGVRFSGQRQFLNVAGQVISSQRFTIVAVVTDQNTGAHREILSNWDGKAGNVGSSVFLGLTGSKTVRLSDDFGEAGTIVNGDEAFVLSAVSDEEEVRISQNQTSIARRSTPLAPRNLKTPWVIGQQGNIDGEFWKGVIAEIVVYDRALDANEQRQVWGALSNRYSLAHRPTPVDPVRQALASLCHVLLNSNEFVYVD